MVADLARSGTRAPPPAGAHEHRPYPSTPRPACRPRPHWGCGEGGGGSRCGARIWRGGLRCGGGRQGRCAPRPPPPAPADDTQTHTAPSTKAVETIQRVIALAGKKGLSNSPAGSRLRPHPAPPEGMPPAPQDSARAGLPIARRLRAPRARGGGGRAWARGSRRPRSSRRAACADAGAPAPHKFHRVSTSSTTRLLHDRPSEIKPLRVW